MDVLINAILPIFLVVLVGFLLGKFKLVSVAISGALMQYVFYSAAPGLVFYAIISNPIDKLLYWRFWIAYPINLLIVLCLTWVVFKVILRRSSFTSLMAGFAAAFANTVIIGYPVLSGFIGHLAALPMSITIIVFMVLMLPFLIFALEVHKNSHGMAKQKISKIIKSSCISLIKNPLIIALILGLICSIEKNKIPHAVIQFTYIIGESITPVALFAVGLELAEFNVNAKLTDIIIITVINLLVMPLVGIGLALLLHLEPIYAVALTIFAAVPTAKTLYVVLSKYEIYTKEAAAILSTTTLFSIITIPLFTYIAQLIWPTVFQH